MLPVGPGQPRGGGTMSGATGVRILVAEDDPIVRKLCVTLLRGAGYDVAAVANGKEALTLLGDETFALIVSDATMPELDGVELVAEVRRRGDTIPILLMSGYSDGRVEANAPGATAHLAKPFTGSALVSAVENALAR